jgi:hypothetical protein
VADVFFPLTWGKPRVPAGAVEPPACAPQFPPRSGGGGGGPFCRTLLAGLVCGALWEAWNFWARTKWIYTVPGFEGLNVFEMPLAGFLGFPPFAVECVVFLRWLGRGGIA